MAYQHLIHKQPEKMNPKMQQDLQTQIMQNLYNVFVSYEVPQDDGTKKRVIILELSDYVTIVITVPETHADAVRESMGKAGAGRVGDYSYCSYSSKGVGRFMPNKGSNPFQGKQDILEEVVEERIETVCNRSVLEHVLNEIKKTHPYEETVIDIYPIYEIARKKAKGNSQ